MHKQKSSFLRFTRMNYQKTINQHNDFLTEIYEVSERIRVIPLPTFSSTYGEVNEWGYRVYSPAPASIFPALFFRNQAHIARFWELLSGYKGYMQALERLYEDEIKPIEREIATKLQGSFISVQGLKTVDIGKFRYSETCAAISDLERQAAHLSKQKSELCEYLKKNHAKAIPYMQAYARACVFSARQRSPLRPLRSRFSHFLRTLALSKKGEKALWSKKWGLLPISKPLEKDSVFTLRLY